MPEQQVWFHGRLVPKSERDHIKALVDAAPPLSEWQKARLRILLRPGPSWPDQSTEDGGERRDGEAT